MYCIPSWVLLLLTLILLLKTTNCDKRGARVRRIVGGEPANIPPEDDPTVYVRFAGKSARIQGTRDYPNYVFRGIRYAEPPTGRNRFIRPHEYFLQGFVNATRYPAPCFQPIPGMDRVVGNEDCLFLNIFSPRLPTGLEGLPVVIWIHGGGFRYGSASQYGVRHLVGKQVLIVTIQYRLGSLGFLSSGTKELPGNAALWDMVLAVQWVRNYIGFFGGNPHRIVVMGHGSGASSAILVALSNVAKGMTSGVVAMSGSSLSHFATDENPGNTARQVAEENGCPTGSTITMVRCLQNLPPASIIKGDSQIEFQRLQNQGFVSGMSGRLGSSPVAEGLPDGRSLPSLVEKKPLEDLSEESDGFKIPLLIGITKDETKRACNGHFKEEILKNLQTIPNFMDQILVKNLQKLVGLPHQNSTTHSKQFWNVLDPLQFRNYLQTKRNDLKDGISKISEATTDALFNVPAFLTAELWSKRGAQSFLYRFEHNGKAKKGHHFLRGLPLIGNVTTTQDSTNDVDNNSDIVGHGDDLSYLFEAQDLHGVPSPDNDNLTETDSKVKDIFTQMIADFVRRSEVSIAKKIVQPFSNTNNNFVQIRSELKLSNDFRYCEMALWCGLSQRLQSATCNLVKVIDKQLKTALMNSTNQRNANVKLVNETRKAIEGSISRVLNPVKFIG